MAVGHSGTGSSVGSIGLVCIDGGSFGTADGAIGVTGTTSSARIMCSSHNVAKGTCVGNGGIGADGEVVMDVFANTAGQGGPATGRSAKT